MRDRLSFQELEYKNHRRESRLDSVFGFKSWDSEDVDNFSSMEETQETERRPQCTICLVNFEGKDKIIKLGCHHKHIYHERCIEDWIVSELKRRYHHEINLQTLDYEDYLSIKCPLCKRCITKESFIQKFERQRRMPMGQP